MFEIADVCDGEFHSILNISSVIPLGSDHFSLESFSQHLCFPFEIFDKLNLKRMSHTSPQRK